MQGVSSGWQPVGHQDLFNGAGALLRKSLGADPGFAIEHHDIQVGEVASAQKSGLLPDPCVAVGVVQADC